jgi:hypothetical protein
VKDINKKYSKSRFAPVERLASHIALLCNRYRVCLFAVSVVGEEIDLADALSRFKSSPFKCHRITAGSLFDNCIFNNHQLSLKNEFSKLADITKVY